jgi:hypothetical protein
MHYLTVFSDSNVIVGYRIDTSVPQHLDADCLNETISKDIRVDKSKINTMVFENPPDKEDGIERIEINRHIFDGVVRVNPNYVQPVIDIEQTQA